MKKITILLSVMIIRLASFSQEQLEFDKYPNIDSLKIVLHNTLTEFKSNKDMSFSNSNIAVNDSLTYSHYNSTTGATVINSTLESEEYIKTTLDPNLSNFISHPDYKFEILETSDSFINKFDKCIIVVMIDSNKYEKQLIVQFNFHHSNKLQHIDITG
jgi:hypothetical protein